MYNTIYKFWQGYFVSFKKYTYIEIQHKSNKFEVSDDY